MVCNEMSYAACIVKRNAWKIFFNYNSCTVFLFAILPMLCYLSVVYRRATFNIMHSFGIKISEFSLCFSVFDLKALDRKDKI